MAARLCISWPPTATAIAAASRSAVDFHCGTGLSTTTEILHGVGRFLPVIWSRHPTISPWLYLEDLWGLAPPGVRWAKPSALPAAAPKPAAPSRVLDIYQKLGVEQEIAFTRGLIASLAP
jgi:hypothetical protein